ncbi:MAG: hypothetical protein HY611_07830 [Elusimicrobia bacterium]|nr:hypothetical protein [Elusimicrobiota bacterium]
MMLKYNYHPAPNPMAIIKYKVSIPVVVAKEDGAIVAYTPALNLGSCGRTQTEALKRLGNAIDLFFSELAEMGTIDKALTELGWHKAGMSRFSAPRTADQSARIQRNIPAKVLARRELNIRIPVAA